MKTGFFILALLCSTLSFAQHGITETEARQLVDTFFEGFHQGDTTKMRSVAMQRVPMQTAYVDKEGNYRVSNGALRRLLLAISKREPTQKWDERLLDYKVQIDGNLAHVWTPYEFWVNDEFSHCGANAFTLVNTNDGWKILHLIDSRRIGSCAEKQKE